MHKRKSLETFQGFTFPVTRPDNNSQIQEGKKWIKYDFKVFIIGIVVFMLVRLEFGGIRKPIFRPIKI